MTEESLRRRSSTEHAERRLTRRGLLRLAAVGAMGALASACASQSARWTFAPVRDPAPEESETGPPPGGEPTAEAGATSRPDADAEPPGGEMPIVRIVGENILFDISEFEVPAETPFRIEFENRDAGIPHNVAIYRDGEGGPNLFRGEIFNGVKTVTYDVPGLQAGDHFFVCDVHPLTMTGTTRVR